VTTWNPALVAKKLGFAVSGCGFVGSARKIACIYTGASQLKRVTKSYVDEKIPIFNGTSVPCRRFSVDTIMQSCNRAGQVSSV
jgi:hypothetical protein